MKLQTEKHAKETCNKTLSMNELYLSFQPTLTETGLNRLALPLKQTRAGAILRDTIHSYLQRVNEHRLTWRYAYE